MNTLIPKLSLVPNRPSLPSKRRSGPDRVLALTQHDLADWLRKNLTVRVEARPHSYALNSNIVKVSLLLAGFEGQPFATSEVTLPGPDLDPHRYG